MSEPERKPSRLERLYNRFRRSPRVEHGFSKMAKEGGFIPLFNIDDTESRRLELIDVLEKNQQDHNEIFAPDKLQDLTPEKVRAYKMTVNNRVFALFFSAGSPWYRGLDDRELTEKVSIYLKIWNYVGGHPSFVDDLFMCSMQLLHDSWKALDVTNTPPYIIETKTIIQPESSRVKLGEETEEM